MLDMDDPVFKALNDPSRRLLLDELFEDDGQTLGELAAHLPDMTRFGVMSHLRVLEEAQLVTTRKDGRRKLHYLNPVPIRLVHDRWISKYTEAKVGAMTQLKAKLEGGTMSKPDHVYQVIINVEPKLVWDAIVNGDMTAQYFYGTRVQSDWTPGATIRYLGSEAEVVADGEILAIEDGRRVEMTFVARWDPELAAEGPSREVWIVDDFNGATSLNLELYDTPEGSKRYADFTSGFPYILSGMKTLLETGKKLPEHV
jgi:DNA-binding transcriptional ArsR family regulator